MDQKPKRSKPCSVCSHDDLTDIQKALVGGEPLSSVAFRFQLAKSSLSRHSSNHMGRGNVGNRGRKNLTHKATSEKTRSDGRCESCGQVVDTEDLTPQAIIKRAEKLLAQSERIALRAEEADDSRLSLLAIDRAQKSLDSLAKIHGLIGPDSVTLVDNRTVNLYASWPTEALEALQRFHAALESGESVERAIGAVMAQKRALPKPKDAAA
jgi:hypothetical protein